MKEDSFLKRNSIYIFAILLPFAVIMLFFLVLIILTENKNIAPFVYAIF